MWIRNNKLWHWGVFSNASLKKKNGWWVAPLTQLLFWGFVIVLFLSLTIQDLKKATSDVTHTTTVTTKFMPTVFLGAYTTVTTATTITSENISEYSKNSNHYIQIDDKDWWYNLKKWLQGWSPWKTQFNNVSLAEGGVDIAAAIVGSSFLDKLHCWDIVYLLIVWVSAIKFNKAANSS